METKVYFTLIYFGMVYPIVFVIFLALRCSKW